MVRMAYSRDRAIDLLLEEVETMYASGPVRDWYVSYMRNRLPSGNHFGDILALLGVDVENTEVLTAVALLFEMSQEAADVRSLEAVDTSYELSMEIISIFTLHNSIFSIIEKRIPDIPLRNRLVDVFNDISLHLNAPRDEETRDVLEGRRRFFLDLYLPLKICVVDVGECETDFVEMYLIKKGSRESGTWKSVGGTTDTQGDFRMLYDKIAGRSRSAEKVLDFLFNAVY